MVAINKNLTFCPTTDCETTIDLKKLKIDNKFTCPKCTRIYCAKCMNIAHGDIACSKVSLDNWIDGGMNNVHRCPKCASIFEKMSGCSEMECSVCHYKWCWVCGLKYESGWHILMLFPCQLINMTVLNESLNKCCRFFMIILYLLVIPTVFLIFFPIMIILMICWEAYENNRHKSNCLGTTLCMMYCNKSHRLKEKVYIYIIKVIFISIQTLKIAGKFQRNFKP